MSSSPPSADGTSDTEQSDAFDFAEAAETLVQLQQQLQEIESAHKTAEEAGEIASALETTSKNVSSVGRQLQETTETLAEACQEISQQPTVPPKDLKNIVSEVSKLKKTVEAADLDRTRPKPRKPPDESSGAYGVTLGGFGLLVVVIGLQVLIWQSLPAPQQSTSSQSEAASESEDARQPNVPTIATLDQVDVQVLNGVGESGLAAEMKSHLKEKGVSVAHVGNAPIGTFDETTIFVHKRAFNVAETLAVRLGLSADYIRPGPTTESGPGLTIVIGDDYESLSAYETERNP